MCSIYVQLLIWKLHVPSVRVGVSSIIMNIIMIRQLHNYDSWFETVNYKREGQTQGELFVRAKAPFIKEKNLTVPFELTEID